MKTFKTNLGIEYDLELSELGHSSVKVISKTHNISSEWKEFEVKITNHHRLSNIQDTEDVSLIQDSELLEAQKWVNETVIGHLASEVAKLCLRKSTKDVYWTYSFGTLNFPNLTITSMDTYAGNVGALRETYGAYGECEIRELLNELNK